jgi:hypothetical protein
MGLPAPICVGRIASLDIAPEMTRDGVRRAFVMAGFADILIGGGAEAPRLADCFEGEFNIIVIRHGVSEAKQGIKHLWCRFDYVLSYFFVSV